MPLHRKIFSTSFTERIHWNGNVIILTKLSSLEVVKISTFSVASDNKFDWIDNISVLVFEK